MTPPTIPHFLSFPWLVCNPLSSKLWGTEEYLWTQFCKILTGHECFTIRIPFNHPTQNFFSFLLFFFSVCDHAGVGAKEELYTQEIARQVGKSQSHITFPCWLLVICILWVIEPLPLAGRVVLLAGSRCSWRNCEWKRRYASKCCPKNAVMVCIVHTKNIGKGMNWTN